MLSYLVRTRAVIRFLRILVWPLGALLLVFSVLLLLLRFVLLPQVDNYRAEIGHELSQAIHLPVTIGHIEGRMQGIRPRLQLHDLAIKDEAGRPALSFDNVVGVVSWISLLKLSPHFYRLEVNAPVLAVRRDAGGHLFIAGLPVKLDRSGPDISAWVLDQHSVVIRDASVTWSDEMRQAPPLTLDQLNLRVEKMVLGRHRFGMTASPPAGLASRLDVRGIFRGDSLADIKHWEGEIYSQVDYADLAGWHAWVDYPVELTRGRGTMRVWLDFANLRPTAVTADLSLADVQIRLAPELALLSLHHLNGRIAARKQGQAVGFSTRQLELATNDGIVVAPTDLQVERDELGGNFTVNKIDFQALSSLAAHLPLPEDFRRQLAGYAPRGSLDQFRLRWRGQQWPPARYSINGAFNKLAIASVGNQPGVSGISGTIDGNETAGMLLLTGHQASLSLPAVFHQPLPLDMLDAQVRWNRNDKHIELKLGQVRFRNADTEGVASGTYEIHDKGMGRIDLDARITRADGAAIWRYMPLQAGPDVGPYLQAGLTQGKVTEATLKLKGNLDKFPFADHSGIFRVHGVFHDAVLRYAEGWPRIDGIAGTLDFDGPAMTIAANDARILGVHAAPVKATIPDLSSTDEQLLVEGRAAGATASFLKFIEASPVGARIDHFTEDMTAVGGGGLDLKLVLPLRNMQKSKVNGSYRFDANRLQLDPDLSPLEDVRGQIEFSAERLGAKGVTATMYGLPLKLNLKTQDDGSVLAEVGGEASAAQLRKQFSHAALKSLAGSTRWSGTVKARKKSAEVRIASDLIGMSSSLPEPFNKSATEAMPLLFERKLADPRLLGKRPRDGTIRNSVELSLGSGLRAQLIYRQEAQSVFERGLVSIGDVAARMPERGLAVAIFQPRINADLWRLLFSDGGDKPVPAKAARATPANDDELKPNRIDLRSTELQALGRVFHDVRISATRPGNSWAADINSRELAAKLEWVDGDNARLSGRITRFAWPEAATANAVADDALKALPNLDLTLDHLALNGHDYGELHLAAENKGGDWNANFTLRNDDGALEGQGRWRLTAAPAAVASETQADFKLHARSIERLMNRIGYPNMVKRGNADLNGHLTWRGAPHDIDFASLNGQLSLDAHDGQFNKLEPGVGRLLGILSLQSIPRRITLDFHDVFSEGFAFDTVKGQVKVSNGVLSTQDMEIRGPAAKVQMAGSADLIKETQDLKVRVQPTVSESAAVGVLLVHPAAGATAWVFNKLFGNPFDKAFAYDFTVTGSWSEPNVDKIGAQPGAAVNKDTGK
ncbi:putative exported protein [Georgfuchsia toluolica]|uniref:Exported protein n=1 Tax=Georgfuchsia toluolica TaxID=424218 RepID=A0A916J4S3_9PROT|nr:YhdP family protein [Georgfuchsia toluolica]CAG4883983.1 putative exported protein [Georgfuchsia toluolica]